MTTTQFKDRNGKIWDLKLTLGKALRVDRADFSALTKTPILLSRFNHDHIVEILTDTALMFAVIGVIVRDQAKENLGLENPSDEIFDAAFTDSIDGDCIEPTRAAFVVELGNFFPQARTALSTFLQKINEYQKKIAEKMTTLLPMMDRKIEQQINQEYQKIVGELQADSQNGTSSHSQPSQELPIGNLTPSDS
jgi:hypothetical protein